MKLSETVSVAYQHVLAYGEPKTGKSTLVAQLARHCKVIWISLDGGHDVLYKLPPEAQENIDLIVLPDTRENPIASETLRHLLEGAAIKICHGHGKKNCSICTASGSPFTNYCLKNLPADTVVVVDNLSQFGDSLMSNIVPSKIDYKPKLDDWGSLSFYAKKSLMDIQSGSYHLVAICHASKEEIESEATKRVVPIFGSSETSKRTAGYFGHVVITHMVSGTHKQGSTTSYTAAGQVQTGSRLDIDISKFDDKDKIWQFFKPLTSTQVVKLEPPKEHGEHKIAELIVLSGAAKTITKEPSISKEDIATVEEKIVETSSAPISAPATAPSIGSSATSNMKEMLAKLRGGK